MSSLPAYQLAYLTSATATIRTKLSVPSPGRNEVLIANAAVAANPKDSAVQVRLLQKIPITVRGPIAKEPNQLSALPQAPARLPGSLRLALDAVGDPPTPPVGDSRRTRCVMRTSRRRQH